MSCDPRGRSILFLELGLRLGVRFGKCFSGVDDLILTDIYAAGEDNAEGVATQGLYDILKKDNSYSLVFKKREDIVSALMSTVRDKSLIAFLGAGKITEVADEFASFVESSYCSE